MKNLKFRISSPAQSEALQLILFRLGADWVNRDKELGNLDAIFIFVENDLIEYSDDESFYKQDIGEEIDTELFIACDGNLEKMANLETTDGVKELLQTLAEQNKIMAETIAALQKLDIFKNQAD